MGRDVNGAFFAVGSVAREGNFRHREWIRTEASVVEVVGRGFTKEIVASED